MSDVTFLHTGRSQPAPFEAAPLPTLADLVAANRQIASYAQAQDRARGLPDLPKPHTLVPATAEKWRQTALEQRRRLLSERDADAAADRIRTALGGPQHADITSMMVAQLLACYQTDKIGNPQTFFEALVFDLSESGFSDVTIAAACLDLRRTAKFRPSIAEVLERCRSKHYFAEAVVAGHRRYVERLKAIHQVLHHTGGDPDPAAVAAYAPVGDEPLLVAEYAKGSANAWWYDVSLNPALMLRETATGEETDEEWRARFLRMKAAVAADPEGASLEAEWHRGRLEGVKRAREVLRSAYTQKDLADAQGRLCLRGRRRAEAGECGKLVGAWMHGANVAFHDTVQAQRTRTAS